MDYAVSKGGRLLEVEEWKNIFARRASHNSYGKTGWTYRAQAFYLTNQWTDAISYALTDNNVGGRQII